ncbi:MAG: 6-phosphogluconolactonase [Gemmatimonadetes bacterium]|nr:6-phosphogluconolactonase [Gemmatimonadota bacterium]
MDPGRIIVDREEFDQAAAAWIVSAIKRTVEAQGRCSIALAGGSTPRPVYWALTQEPFRSAIPWQRLWVYFGDERAVPPDHPDSNFCAAREALLRHVAVPETQVFRMEAERADREAAAEEYARVLPARLDILILGMGPDGHTASLFPGSSAMEERERRVVPVIGPKPPAARLTITPPVIGSAREAVVLVTGEDKAATLARALQGPMAPRDLPAQLAREGTWILDRAAAGGLA